VLGCYMCADRGQSVVVCGVKLNRCFYPEQSPRCSGNIKGFNLRFSCQEYLAFLKVKNRFCVVRFQGG